MKKCTALVVAAGRGTRLGGDVPKQYLRLGHSAVLRRSLAVFLAHPLIEHVLAVIHPDDKALYDQAALGLGLPEPIIGGETRQESVLLGLKALVSDAPDYVLIHDGARPLVDGSVISRVVNQLQSMEAVVPAIAMTDSLKKVSAKGVVENLDRRDVWRVQTPQGFHYPHILSAHRAFRGQDMTDDAAVAEQAGLSMTIVAGDEDNFKITHSGDLERARHIVSTKMDYRVGSGFDVHAFTEGSGVHLCGVFVPHDKGLAGHSDADVALHAVTDAILGACAAGDIGQHFPPSDARWKGAESHIFLSFAQNLLAGLGGRLVNVDITVIGERPKISPHRAAMQAKLAQILGVSENRISVKATTTEKLGFAGRSEGLAAQATVMVQLPSF